MDNLIEQGAESKIYFINYCNNQAVLKRRFKKTYRHHLLDERLTKERIRAEARALLHLKLNCSTLSSLLPTIYFVNDSDIVMTRFVDYQTLNQVINNDALERKTIDHCLSQVGRIIALIHKNGIVHGDLTTTNFLIKLEENKVVPIDFGLACFSTSSEDRAVDLYVLERSLLTSKTSTPQNLDLILDCYSSEMSKEGVSVLSKLNEVRTRGRKRLMIG